MRWRQRALSFAGHHRRPPAALDFPGALRGEGIGLIAEVKKASPSKGLLREDFHPTELAATYSGNGAAAISVITDNHFLGEPAHLTAVKESGASGSVPVLRKDFLFDPYQVYEARAIGADTYLLIVDILSPSQLAELIHLGSELGMTPLVETHDAEEIATAVAAGATVIGINNRDLHTFVTDLATTESLAPLIPAGKVIVSESGISTPEDLTRAGALRDRRRAGRRGPGYRCGYGGQGSVPHRLARSGLGRWLWNAPPSRFAGSVISRMPWSQPKPVPTTSEWCLSRTAAGASSLPTPVSSPTH